MPLNVLNADELFIALQTALAGRYSLDRELGRGGMGVVYLAREVHLDRLVAIKVLPPRLAADAAARERFLREARLAARLSHPHIIPIHAVEQHGDFVFYVMTWVDGESLARRVATRGPLAAHEGARLLRDVAWALAYAHGQGVVHRDIKPDNILLERDSGRAIVADFGIAAAVGDAMDGGAGTPEFMSPEQALGRPASASSDLYSLGATAWFAFTGRPPFIGDDANAIVLQHLEAPVPSLSGRVTHQLEQLLRRCLAKTPEERPRDAQDVADALSALLERRREMPAVLRAFVKRDGRTDGVGTIATLLGALVGGVLLSSVTSDVVGLAAMVTTAVVGSAGFLVAQARRLQRQGFVHADLEPAYVAEQEVLREEREVRVRPAARLVTRALRLLTQFAATLSVLCMVVSVVSGGPRDLVPLLALASAAIAVILLLLWLVALQAQRDVDVAFWRTLWTGGIGELAFRVARALYRDAPTAHAMTHRATELSLGLASEQLYDALPRDMRDALPELPEVLARLQAAASVLREQWEGVRVALAAMKQRADVPVRELELAQRNEQDLAARHRDAVATLETLRLNLLRLHAGQIGVDGVTTHVAIALEQADHVRRLADAYQGVDDIFGAIQTA